MWTEPWCMSSCLHSGRLWSVWLVTRVRDLLVSTCQSLGELCRPCDNTYPLTLTETMQHGRKDLGAVHCWVWLNLWWFNLCKNNTYTSFGRFLILLSVDGGQCRLIENDHIITAEFRMTPTGYDCVSWTCDTSVQVETVICDPSCENDLDLRGHRERSYTVKWLASPAAHQYNATRV